MFGSLLLLQGESTDNFNWGVRRRPLSEGEEEQPSLKQVEDSISERTPILTVRKVHVCPFNHNVSVLFGFLCCKLDVFLLFSVIIFSTVVCHWSPDLYALNIINIKSKLFKNQNSNSFIKCVYFLILYLHLIITFL